MCDRRQWIRCGRKEAGPDDQAATRGTSSSDGANVVLATLGLTSVSFVSLQWYHHAHAKPMNIKAIARMVQSILYGRRFFPYFTYVILGGIDETDGKHRPIRTSS